MLSATLARYHQDYDTLGVKSASLSQRYYHQALALVPEIGNAKWIISVKILC